MKNRLFFDSHVHIVPPGFTSNYHSCTVKDLIDKMKKLGVNKCIVTLNPFLEQVMCDKGHIVVPVVKENKYLLECKTCGKIIYKGDKDPYRTANISMLEECKKFKNTLFPFIYLSIGNSEITAKEINYFENRYNETFYGYKLIGSFSQTKVNGKYIQMATKPLLFHTKNDEYSSPIQIINETRNIKVPIILAHFASFNQKALALINDSNNLYIDISPIEDLVQNLYVKSDKIFINTDFDNMEEIIGFIKKALSLIPKSKVLYGSDFPWGNIEAQMKVLSMLNLETSALDDNFMNIINYCHFL